MRADEKLTASWELESAIRSAETSYMNGFDPRLPSPAPEILDYLARHPTAQDTIDGILHWWVLDTYVRQWAPKIAETLAQLVERGFLEEKLSSDGKTYYRVSPLYLSTLQQSQSTDL